MPTSSNSSVFSPSTNRDEISSSWGRQTSVPASLPFTRAMVTVASSPSSANAAAPPLARDLHLLRELYTTGIEGQTLVREIA